MKMLQTERLLLRPFTPNDSAFILELLNTEGWIKFIGDRNVRTTEQAKNYIENGPIKSYRVNGLGLSLVEVKGSNRSVGMCGLLQRDYLDYPDLGFAFLPGETGKGYAHEIAKAVVDYAFGQLKAEKILAITLPENIRSVNLLQKLGFRYERDFITKDTNETLSLYSLGINQS